MLETEESASTSLRPVSKVLMESTFSEVAAMTGEVGSGLVPGLKGYGVSSRLPTKNKKKRMAALSRCRINEEKKMSECDDCVKPKTTCSLYFYIFIGELTGCATSKYL